MSKSQFDVAMRRIEELELEYERNPTAFVRRSMLLVLFGYGWLLIIGSAFLGLLGVLVYEIFFAQPQQTNLVSGLTLVVVLFFVFLSHISLKVESPPGVELPWHLAGGLRREVEAVRKSVGGPGVGRLVFGMEASASMTARPVGGIPLIHRHVLSLGVPLSAGLSVRQLRSVIAHEFAHRSYRQGRPANLLRLAVFHFSMIEQQGGGVWFLLMLPQYNEALQFRHLVLDRRKELDADQVSASLTGPKEAGDALVRALIIADYVDRVYWPKLFEQSRKLLNPPNDAVSGLVRAIQSGEAERLALPALIRALRDRTAPEDSHPSVADRLAGIGWPSPERPLGVDDDLERLIPELPKPADRALDSLLSMEVVHELISALDHMFVAMTADSWTELHITAQVSQRQLAKALSELPALPTAEQYLEIALLQVEANGMEAAVPYFEAVLAREPDQLEAGFLLGQYLIEKDDPEGVGLLEHVAAHDPSHRLAACDHLYRFFRSEGDIERAAYYRNVAQGWQRSLERMTAEISDERRLAKLPLRPITLRAVHRERLVHAFRSIEAVSKAWVCHVEPPSAPEMTVLAIGIENQARRRLFRLTSSKDQERKELAGFVADQLKTPHLFVVFHMAGNRKLRKRMMEVCGEPMFDRATMED